MMREVWVGGTGKRTWQVQLVRETNVERENILLYLIQGGWV